MSVAARRYAKAIFALAQEANALEAIGTELEQLAILAGDPDIAHALANPLLAPATRQAIAQTLAKQLELRPVTTNFVRLLADHRRLDQLVAIREEYQRLMDQALGQVRAKIVSAAPLTPAQQDGIVSTFERITGKRVLPATTLDPTLLGGVSVEIEGKVYDGSVRTQLARMAAAIAGSRSYL